MNLIFLKNLIILAGTTMFFANQLTAQTKSIEREWTSFHQSLDLNIDKRQQFRLSVDIKALPEDPNGACGIWVNIENRDGSQGFSDSRLTTDSSANKWQKYTIEGFLDENSSKLDFGGMALRNGHYYFDNFQLLTKGEGSQYIEVELANAGFEYGALKTRVPSWHLEKNKDGLPIKVEGFSFHASDEAFVGKQSLLIKGSGIKRDNRNFLQAEEGYTPQIGSLVAMLNNLRDRVEAAVKDLDQRELDHLVDDKANSIGALVMHLAAAEAFYQVVTFEGRGFNEEEAARWQVALDLDTEGRKDLVDKPVQYYLDAFREVRAKTLEEFKMLDDDWLERTPPGALTNNYFSWFHVMEHQSSHLGQIRLLKKRIPDDPLKDEEIELLRN